MTDARLVQSGDYLAEAVTIELLLTPVGDLDASQELATAMIVALLTDRLAQPDDALPDPNSDDRRGWWGDLDASEIWDGWPIGCRLWLLSRAKITPPEAREGATVVRVEHYIREALEPLLRIGVGSKLDVAVRRSGNEAIEADIVLSRGPRPAIRLRFADLWNGILVSAPTGIWAH